MKFNFSIRYRVSEVSKIVVKAPISPGARTDLLDGVLLLLLDRSRFFFSPSFCAFKDMLNMSCRSSFEMPLDSLRPASTEDWRRGRGWRTSSVDDKEVIPVRVLPLPERLVGSEPDE